ncbi:MAG: hypothetical protein A2Y78_00260 [Acidobacteria bacterium RBG_13_68_16]|nr:MAG: hypothetical protein A2Y78_00260 [Acidobacteria bacterium RBG_13_68_16]
MTSPAAILAWLGGLEGLPPDELAIALFDPSLTLRAEQIVPPPGSWRSFTFVAGRGAGKTFGLVADLHRGVEAGDITRPALLGPNFDDVRDKQVLPLVESSPPWFRAEPYKRGVRWPNGVEAPGLTAEVERPASGANFDYVWMTELVKWQESTRVKAFEDVTTACRVGPAPRYVIDTTSQGVNDLILAQLARCEEHPEIHILRRGTIFDNPYLSREYLISEIEKYGWGTRKAEEELLGLVFAQTAGALWQRDWIDSHRREFAPPNPDTVLLAWDPALSDSSEADEQGLCEASLRTDDGPHVYVLRDLSRRTTPADAARDIVSACEASAAGVVVETNHAGLMPRQLLEAEARQRGMRVELVPREARIPKRRPGTIWLKEYHTPSAKAHRATAPAALYRQGRVHHVGSFPRLESEQTTWEPGSRRSPNRLDAAAYVVAELAGLTTGAPRDTAAAAGDARAAHIELQKRLRAGRPGGRRLGV